ncbi:MAG: hypothetical protein ACRDGT_11880 [Candidatus Limnocylindria bacterium]
MNVLAGLAEGVLDAILEREDDPGRDPFAMALERYRTAGPPLEAAPSWRRGRRAPPSAGDPSRVLRMLDRELLSGVLGYATATATAEGEPADRAEEEDASPTLAVIGAGGPMPSLEMAADGTWHVAASAAAEARHPGDAARASVPTLASRYPARRGGAAPGLPPPHDRS